MSPGRGQSVPQTDLSGTTLTLTFSAGVGLHTWRRIGSLERELAIYRRLAGRLGAVNLVTYGGARDWPMRSTLSPIAVLPTIWTPSTAATEGLLWMMHRRRLGRTSIIKTNQIPGSDVALRLARRVGALLVVRCGYVWSLNRSRETVDQGEIERVRKLERQSFDAADLGIVTTDASRTYVIDAHDLDPSKIRVVPNYVDTEHFRPASESLVATAPRPRLVFVGRLAVEKNIEALIEAVAMYQRRTGERPELVLVGQGPLRRALEQLASRLGVTVDFRGSVPHYELPHVLSTCHVFVLPSLYEGHPKALLEAMACGIPVLGTNVAGIREEIRSGLTGQLCEPDAESICGGIESLLGDEGLRMRLAAAGAAHVVDNYSLAAVEALELAVLSELVAS